MLGMIRCLAVILALFTTVSLHAQVRLKSDLATTKEIALSWIGSASRECRVERKTDSDKWSEIVKTTEAKTTDSKISAFGTYTYRVSCAPNTSNEIMVGPPPAGFHAIAPKPEKRPDTSFGRLLSVALDANGDPAAAFEYADPNGDGNSLDSEIMFVSWDRATYRWKPPVSVAVVGNFDPRPPTSGISLAHDAATGTFGVTWVDTDTHGLNLALSRDGGTTWTVQKALTDARGLAGPTLALADGKIHLAVAQDSHNSIRYMTGKIDEAPGQWKVSFAPMLAGSTGVHRGSWLALDSNGAPALAYWLRPASGPVWTLALWRPGTEQPVKVTDSGDSGYPPDGVQLAFAGMQPRIVLDSRLRRSQISSHYSLFSKDQGATWSSPVAIPDDGNEHIGGFMSFSVSADDRGAFAGDVVGGNTTGMRCTWPKLARTSDFNAWTTCSPQGGMQPDARTNWGTVIFAPSGMLYMIFQNRLMSTQPLPAGLLIWGGR